MLMGQSGDGQGGIGKKGDSIGALSLPPAVREWRENKTKQNKQKKRNGGRNFAVAAAAK